MRVSQEAAPYLTDPEGNRHVLNRPDIRVGRAVDNELVITSKRVSRLHAHIYNQGRRTLLEDLNSVNGTFLNGERITGPVFLRDEDRLQIGELEFTFHDPETTTRDTPFPELEMNIEAGLVKVDRRIVSLSAKEFALLAYLFTQRGKVCSKDEIAHSVWPDYQESVFDYQIENLVRRLRTRIEIDPTNPQLLLTVRGLGYKLVTQSGEEQGNE